MIILQLINKILKTLQKLLIVTSLSNSVKLTSYQFKFLSTKIGETMITISKRRLIKF